ncbi:MAG: hypothetical protein BGP06_17395 [Rhizobiales bacterium 65-9]|nr:ABC transporter ATP-binding protein [Hyphomicrobiales bacterium]OJY40209.1 MAG: hypothetical protein BGP06_17395 [Rhizobiales bacterium 65-9]
MSGLVLRNISMRFAGLLALDDVAFNIGKGLVTSLIGPNGAGKTTLVNVITGILRPTSGQVSFNGGDIAGLSSLKIARAGIRRTFQQVRLFDGLTVRENLIVSQQYELSKTGFWHCLLPGGFGGGSFAAEADRLLAMFGLQANADVLAGDLSFGDQRRVEIARALAGSPSLILLDEPAAGMNDVETEQLRQDIEAIKRNGVTVFLIEHDMSLVMSVSDRVVVLNFGRKIAEGTPAEVQANPAVIDSYLGSEDDD